MPPRFAFVKTPAWGEADAEMRETLGDFVRGSASGSSQSTFPSSATSSSGSASCSWRKTRTTTARSCSRPRSLFHPGSRSASRRASHRRAGYLRAITGREPAYRCVSRGAERLQRDPHARGARTGAGRPRRHRQSDNERPVDLPRHAGGVATAARGRRAYPSACNSSACAMTTGASCARALAGR